MAIKHTSTFLYPVQNPMCTTQDFLLIFQYSWRVVLETQKDLFLDREENAIVSGTEEDRTGVVDGGVSALMS